MMTTTASERKLRENDPFVTQFEPFERAGATRGPAWVFPVRKAGLARFAERGFPTTSDEDWRFTNVAAVGRLPFRLATPSEVGGRDILGTTPFATHETDRLVFVDGHYEASLSNVGELPSGAVVMNLAGAIAGGVGDLEHVFGRHVTGEENGFAALNAAYFSDGGYIFVPKGVALLRPVQLCFVSTGAAAGVATHPRNLVIVEEGASATVLETYTGLNGVGYLTNSVGEVVVGDNGYLEHVRFQDERVEAFHVGTLHYRLGRASRCWAHSLALGSKLSRVNIRASLAGEGLEAVLNGLYLTRGEQLADHHMVVDHIRPHCVSHEYFNGILDDRSRGVFHGRILVRREAQKTDAKQTNRNLLLSEDATVDTKPQLEIYADDVRCTHGATVGQMNEDSIFYLRARGIGLERARRILMCAFAGEIIERVQDEAVREELDRIVWVRLEQNPHVKTE